MQAARAWGKVPSEWDALTSDDRIEMLALVRVENRMSAWDAQVARAEAEERARNAARGEKRRKVR